MSSARKTAFIAGALFVITFSRRSQRRSFSAALILGSLMYRSGLVPRGMAMLGLIGGPLIIAPGTAVLFNVIQPGSASQFIATIPEFVWELPLGIYLMVKGFKPSPITAENRQPAHVDALVPAV